MTKRNTLKPAREEKRNKGKDDSRFLIGVNASDKTVEQRYYQKKKPQNKKPADQYPSRTWT